MQSQVPGAGFIESGIDSLKKQLEEQPTFVIHELKELHFASGHKVLDLPFPNGTPDFAKGYLLGLQTARALLMGSVVAVQADVMI